MTKLNKKLISMVLMMIMIMSSAAYGVQSFTDVSENHWAFNTIENVNAKNIMPGYSDATYRADSNVTRLESLVAIYRVMKMSGKVTPDQEKDLVIKYKSTIEELNIPPMLSPYGADSFVACAYALENNILEKDELKYFVANGKLTEAKKLDVAVFLGKAINIYQKENLNKFIAFDYKDAFDITPVSAPYVYLLIEKGIISSKGDASGNFNAKSAVSRAVLATMIQGAYNFMVGSDLVTDTNDQSGTNSEATSNSVSETTNSTTSDTSNSAAGSGSETSNASTSVDSYTISAKISSIHTDKEIIEVRDGLNKLKAYDTSVASILVGGQKMGIASLEVGQEVKLSVTGTKLIKIEVDKTYEKTTGYVDQVSTVNDPSIGTYMVLVVKKDTNKKEYYKAYASTFTTLNGEEVKIDKLSQNDKVIVSYEGFDAKKVEAYGKIYEVSGVILNDSEYKSGSKAMIKLSDGSTLEQVLADGVNISSTAGGIKRGDIVNVTLEYGVVKKIENTGMTATATGMISEIIISQNPKLSVTNGSGEKRTYPISKNVSIVDKDGKALSDIYDLRLDSDVSLDLDASGITKIKVNEKHEKIKFQGTITEIYKSSGLLKIKGVGGKVYIVNFKAGVGLSIENYNVGDSVYIFGIELSDELFEAEMIINVD